MIEFGNLPVYCLCGPKRCGKTTIAKYLFDKHSFIHVEEGDICRDIARDFCGWPGVYGDDTEEAKKGRRLLQELGQIVKFYDRTNLIRMTAMRAVAIVDKMIQMRKEGIPIPEPHGIVIGAVREPDEVQFCNKHGWETWLVLRDTGLKDTHINESSICTDPSIYKRVVTNNGTIEDLYEQVECHLNLPVQSLGAA